MLRDRGLPVVALGSIVAGGALWLSGHENSADIAWAVGAVAVLVPLVISTARALLRGDVGVDAIALVAIVWALALGEFLAGAIVALMMSGGAALEAWADGRARRELRLLVERAPRIAHRYVGESLEEVQVEDLLVGDLVSVRAGEIVPADGTVTSREAVLDESALTGEALPVTITSHGQARSGTANAGDTFDLRITAPAAQSAYAAIVRLVRSAEVDRAQFTRLADRYAAYFLPFSLAVAGLAWLASGDPTRGLAVMVVATPCPLILAAPIAFVAGLSRAARAGIIVKGGGVLERLGTARTVLLDKTGTLTLGEPKLEEIIVYGKLSADHVLRLAASIDQMSTHVLAESLVSAAAARELALSIPTGVSEDAGRGIVGTIDGSTVAVGSSGWLESNGYIGVRERAREHDTGEGAGRAKILVGVDGALAAVIVMGDRLRPGAHTLARELQSLGVTTVALVTGDRAEIAEEVARTAGIEHVYSEQTPEGKLDVVRATRDREEMRNVVMVGDGINDAPALALADVGIAIAGKGATISSETADVVITVDNANRVALSIGIGQRSLHIARQSVGYGLGLSVAAMLFAAFGYLPPVWGALFQEVIDVAVILNALRALRA
ncbi:heavy metal translocating P-type ATPase [Gaiella sp.]|uniref:heavy metal translocating P-type ATPase n=1 Tax=Gaiella sp. TaxID=2663207 RepID=UPI0032654B2A